MLMNLYQTAALLALLVTAGCGLSSCSGATDDSETALAVELAYDKASIDADGESAVTFTVKQGGVDITAKATISYTYGEETKELAQATFSTNVAGTYTFTATYDGQSSKPVSITANEITVVKSQFVRRICVMEFTGTWCTFCPSGALRLQDMLVRNFDGIYDLMAFHLDKDPMAIPQSSTLMKKFKQDGAPACAVDMREGMDISSGPAKAKKACENSLENYPAHCGVAIASVYNEASKTAEVTVKVNSEKTSKYRLAVYVLEDGIVYPQADGSITRDDYVHNHVVRKLIAASGLVEGDDLGEIASGKEATKTYQVNIDKAWNIENLSFYALALDAENRVNNLSVCAAKNGKTDYEYNKNN